MMTARPRHETMKARLTGTATLLLLAGCGRSAAIQHTGGETIGRMTSSTATHLVVETEVGKKYLARSEVLDINHPGNEVALVGLAVATWGIVGLVSPASVGCEGEESQFCGILTVPLTAAGVGLLTYGAWAWSASVAAASSIDAKPRGTTALQMSPGFRLQLQRRF